MKPFSNLIESDDLPDDFSIMVTVKNEEIENKVVVNDISEQLHIILGKLITPSNIIDIAYDIVADYFSNEGSADCTHGKHCVKCQKQMMTELFKQMVVNHDEAMFTYMMDGADLKGLTKAKLYEHGSDEMRERMDQMDDLIGGLSDTPLGSILASILGDNDFSDINIAQVMKMKEKMGEMNKEAQETEA